MMAEDRDEVCYYNVPCHDCKACCRGAFACLVKISVSIIGLLCLGVGCADTNEQQLFCTNPNVFLYVGLGLLTVEVITIVSVIVYARRFRASVLAEQSIRADSIQRFYCFYIFLIPSVFGTCVVVCLLTYAVSSTGNVLQPGLVITIAVFICIVADWGFYVAVRTKTGNLPIQGASAHYNDNDVHETICGYFFLGSEERAVHETIESSYQQWFWCSMTCLVVVLGSTLMGVGCQTQLDAGFDICNPLNDWATITSSAMTLVSYVYCWIVFWRSIRCGCARSHDSGHYCYYANWIFILTTFLFVLIAAGYIITGSPELVLSQGMLTSIATCSHFAAGVLAWKRIFTKTTVHSAVVGNERVGNEDRVPVRGYRDACLYFWGCDAYYCPPPKFAVLALVMVSLGLSALATKFLPFFHNSYDGNFCIWLNLFTLIKCIFISICTTKWNTILPKWVTTIFALSAVYWICVAIGQPFSLVVSSHRNNNAILARLEDVTLGLTLLVLFIVGVLVPLWFCFCCTHRRWLVARGILSDDINKSQGLVNLGSGTMDSWCCLRRDHARHCGLECLLPSPPPVPLVPAVSVLGPGPGPSGPAGPPPSAPYV